MNKRRDKPQIIHDILKYIQDKKGNARPTHILYKSNLSHQMMNDYIKEMISKKLISEVSSTKGRSYSIEKNGYEFLSKYKMVTDFLDLFGLND